MSSLPRAPLVGKTPPAGGGGTQVPKGERLSSECETERLYEEQLHLELTAIETLFVRVRVSLCFSFSSAGLALSGADAPAVPLFGFAIFPRPGEIFPKGGALGKTGNIAGTAKASHFERLPRPGEVARKCQKGARCLRSRRRGQGCCQRARHTAIRTLLVRAIVSQRRWSNFTGLALSGADAPAPPKWEPLAKRCRFAEID